MEKYNWVTYQKTKDWVIGLLECGMSKKDVINLIKASDNIAEYRFMFPITDKYIKHKKKKYIKHKNNTG